MSSMAARLVDPAVWSVSGACAQQCSWFDGPRWTLAFKMLHEGAPTKTRARLNRQLAAKTFADLFERQSIQQRENSLALLATAPEMMRRTLAREIARAWLDSLPDEKGRGVNQAYGEHLFGCIEALCPGDAGLICWRMRPQGMLPAAFPEILRDRVQAQVDRLAVQRAAQEGAQGIAKIAPAKKVSRI